MRGFFVVLFCSLIASNQMLDRNIIRTKKDYIPEINQSYRDNRNEDELVNYIESVIDLNNVAGVSVAVVKSNQMIWNKSFGMANIEESIPVSDSTMFMLASVSKTVTATALMQLWESGMIDLDVDINNYLPFNVRHPNYLNAPITAKMLLTHTSSIRDNWGVMDYYDGDPDLSLGYYLEQYLTPGGIFYNQNSNFTNQQPGSNYSYSNIGAALIGYLVEVISSQPFNEYCNQYIFEPLDMDSRWFLSELNIDNIAIPYRFTGGSGDNCYDIGCGIYSDNNPCQCDSECVDWGDCCIDYQEVCGEGGSGGGDLNLSPINHYGYADYPSGQLRSSAADLAKFAILYTNNGIYDGTRILDAETVDFMKQIPYPNVNDQQAIVWYYKNQASRTLFGHNGGDLGVITDMFISLPDEVGVIVLSNSENYAAVIEIEKAVFDFVEQYGFQLNGDLNNDGTLNIMDVIIMVNLILNQEYLLNADLNNDQYINVSDIVLLINIILAV